VAALKPEFLSRNEKDLGSKSREVQNSIAALDVQDVMIDGEIVSLDDKGRPSFQLLQGFDAGPVRALIVFYAFVLLICFLGIRETGARPILFGRRQTELRCPFVLFGKYNLTSSHVGD
jgi:bifunctional non-homologous end joining protein LigD